MVFGLIGIPTFVYLSRVGWGFGGLCFFMNSSIAHMTPSEKVMCSLSQNSMNCLSIGCFSDLTLKLRTIL